MIQNYTLEAKDRCLDLVDRDADAIWEGLADMPAEAGKERWREKLLGIAREYTFSSRFALMRIILAQAPEGSLVDKGDPARGFSHVFKDGSGCVFSQITMEHAETLSPQEVGQYERLLLERAARQRGADPLADGALVRKAFSPVGKRTTLLTREEAMCLGHCLQLTLDEMEWFLLRVFDVGDGFSYRDAGDLVEAYGFLTGADAGAVAALRAEYQRRFGDVEGTAQGHEDEDWTQDMGSSLGVLVRTWGREDLQGRDERFLQWLGERAPCLGMPSQRALRIYRDLAVYARNLADLSEQAPDVDQLKGRGCEMQTDFVRAVRELAGRSDYADQTREALFEGGALSERKCKEVAAVLLRENAGQAFSSSPDRSKAWHSVVAKGDGKPTSTGGINASRTRVQDLLSGKERHIEKPDILYLLWFFTNQCWGASDPPGERSQVGSRLMDFIDAAENCLNACGMPAFYPPHLLEQSMMISVVYAYCHTQEKEPAEVYEEICQSFIVSKGKKMPAP